MYNSDRVRYRATIRVTVYYIILYYIKESRVRMSAFEEPFYRISIRENAHRLLQINWQILVLALWGELTIRRDGQSPPVYDIALLPWRLGE